MHTLEYFLQVHICVSRKIIRGLQDRVTHLVMQMLLSFSIHRTHPLLITP